MGSPKQSIAELWECLTSYQLRHHLLDDPYVLVLAFILALPSFWKAAWMSWNVLAVIFFYCSIFFFFAACQKLHYFLPAPLASLYGLDSMSEQLWQYETIFIFYPLLFTISLWCGKSRIALILIIGGSYLIWRTLSDSIAYITTILSPSQSWVADIQEHGDLITLSLMLFLLLNSLFLSISMPRILIRRISKEEQEWIEHVQEYKHQRSSFMPSNIPDLPPPPPLQ